MHYSSCIARCVRCSTCNSGSSSSSTYAPSSTSSESSTSTDSTSSTSDDDKVCRNKWIIMNCRYGTANFSQNHVYADCECVYGNLSSRVSPCCTPKHCGHNVCCRLHGTTRMSWLNDILHEELLEKPWRWISRPIGYYPYKMLRNRSVKLVFQLSS